MWASLWLETRLIVRDRTLIAAFLLLISILVGSVLAGRSADLSESRALASAAKRVQAEWDALPPKNPHEAAHYGLLIYRPRASLQALDAGVLPYQGAVTFLEAHKRNQPMLSAASVRNADTRYGGTRFSPLLQIAGGFLALLIGFLVGSREQRRGIAALVLGVGANAGAVTSAKAMVASGLVASAALPAFLLASNFVASGDPLARLGALAGFSLIHLMVLAALGVAAGLVLGNRRGGAALVLVIWAVVTIVVPRLGDSVADRVVPVTQTAIDADVEEAFKKGPNGHDPNIENIRFEQRVLAQYGVTRKEDLPINLDALTMQAEEDYHHEVYNRVLGDAERRRHAQDSIRAAAWLLSPTPAMLDLSARLAGTDASAETRFDSAGEENRLGRVRRLNMYMAANSKTGDWDWKAQNGFFRTFGEFNPPRFRLVDDWPGAVPAVLALLAWSIVALVALALAGRRSARSLAQ